MNKIVQDIKLKINNLLSKLSGGFSLLLLKIKNPRFKLIFLIVFFFIVAATLSVSIYMINNPKEVSDSRASSDVVSTDIKDSYDIVIVGAGTGGIGAAIQAARSGSKVLLLEETDYIGGQMLAGGVSTMDIIDTHWGTGIYREFINKVRARYSSKGIAINTCFTTQNPGANLACFEPHVGREIITQMISEEPNITLALKTSVTSVQKNGSKISGLTINTGKFISTNVIIDATEYGDIIPMAGASYRIGNKFNSSPVGEINNSCVQSITYVGIIKRYPGGVPSELILRNSPPGYDQVKESFAKSLTNDGSSVWGNYPINWDRFLKYRGLPYFEDSSSKMSKTAINMSNDYPSNGYITDGKTMDLPKLSARYIEDKNYRRDVNCQAKLKTIQLLYYIQHDLGKSDWSISRDEGYSTQYNKDNSCTEIIPEEFRIIENNLAVVPYVRESRRGVGLVTLTAKDMKRSANPLKVAKLFPTSIAIGEYANDLHNCSADIDLEIDMENRNDITLWSQGPFEVPIGTLISKDVEGLIFAEKNISVSRLANGATRLQPITMLTGQAAGALAAISVQEKTSPANATVMKVQRALLEENSMLVPFKDMTPDTEYFIDMQQMALRGIINGYGNLMFGVLDPLTRGQAAAVLDRTFNIPIVENPVGEFSDVPPTHFYAKFIEGLVKAGLTKGCSSNPPMFCPDKPVTNAQMAVFLLRGWMRLNSNIQMNNQTISSYRDVATNYWSFQYIENLAKNGLTWYCNNESKDFCPELTMTRGRAANLLNTILNK